MQTYNQNFIHIQSENFDFHISKYQVTMKEYLAFVHDTSTHYPEWMDDESPCHLEKGDNDLYEDQNFEDNAPIIGISWEDAQAYCAWLSQKEGVTFRLATEAEWEYACRAETTTPYSCPEEELSDHAWYYANAFGEAHEVGSKKPNPWGLYDMHGNVWEWCQDSWRYEFDPSIDLENCLNPREVKRVLRGGSWFEFKENATSSSRHRYELTFRYIDVGFRVVKTQ